MTDVSSLGVGAPRRRAPLHTPVAVARYLLEQFPPLQIASLVVGACVAYALSGRSAGSAELDAAAAVGAATFVLLFLLYRLVDDLCTYCNPELGGPEVIPARPRPLIAGSAVTLAAVVAVEQQPGPLAFALATAVLMIVCSAVLSVGQRLPVSRFVAQVPFLEVAPLLVFAYVVVKWGAANDDRLSLLAVVAVIANSAIGFQIWKWSRHLGDDPHERIYRVSWQFVRGVLVLLAALAVVCAVVLYREADLSAAYVGWVTAISVVFAALAWPRGQADERRPWWAGLAMPAALQGGMAVQLAFLL
jgi:hypothetical protein